MGSVNKSELAKRFSVSTTTVDNWTRRGCPRKGQRGRELRFDVGKVRRWLEDRAKAEEGPSDLTDARTKKWHYQALLAELEYRKQIGELVRADEVRGAAFATARRVRDALLNLPSRISSILAAESDSRKIHELLSKEIRQALEALARDSGRPSGTVGGIS